MDLNWKDNIVFLIALVIFAEWVIRGIVNFTISKLLGERIAYIYDTKITAIGVMHHELSHALFALLTGAAVEGISLINFRIGESRELGSVKFRTRGPLFLRWYQCVITSLAPSIMGIVTTGIASYLILNTWEIYQWKILKEIWIYPAVFVMGCVSYHASPSFQDIKISIVPISLILVASLFLKPVDWISKAYGIAIVMICIMAAAVVPVICVSAIKSLLNKIYSKSCWQK